MEKETKEYDELFKIVKEQLEQVNKALKTHSKRYKKKKENTGFATDLLILSSKLKELNFFVNQNN